MPLPRPSHASRALLAVLVAVACSRHSAGVAPAAAEPEAVGAVEVFGRGIVTLDGTGGRALVAMSVPAYVALVRLDGQGAVTGAAASGLRHDPGTVWLELPEAGRSRRVSAATAPPSCDDVSVGSRRQCLGQQVRSDRATAPAGLAPGESVLLFLMAEPMTPAGLEERLNAVSRRVPLAQLPGAVMADRHGLWAAYLLRPR